MGMRCSDTAVIYFEDVRVPAKNIIGQEGYGFTYQMLQFQQERLACAALSLMPLERCIADTIGKKKCPPPLKQFHFCVLMNGKNGWVCQKLRPAKK